MVQLNTTNNKTLNIILANTNKALREVLQQSNPKELLSFIQTKDLGSVLESLLRNNPQNKIQNQELLQLLKNNPTLKELSNVTTTLKSLQNILQKNLQQNPKNQFSHLFKLQKLLITILSDTKNIDNALLKNKIENSGIFLESKLKNFTSPQVELKLLLQDLSTTLQNSKVPRAQTIAQELNTLIKSELFSKTSENPKVLTQLTQKLDTLLEKTIKQMNSDFDKMQHPKDILFTKATEELYSKISLLNHPTKLQEAQKIQELFSNDLKHIVKKSLEELQNTDLTQKHEIVKQLDKISLQIDYYQLLSHLSDASAIYLPYSFDALEDGSISIKNTKNGRFFCDIDLELKEYGKLKLRLGIFEKNQLNINIECQSGDLQIILQENLKDLRENLFNVGIYPKDIRFLNYEKEDINYADTDDLTLGFEVKA